ncbi:MAG TPA: response regulator transcription factor [Rhizobiales bacterium]|nr:transcriptional regulatory protein QseB [bacterium BMS3Bbin10]HDO52183.1 response regulator transcription factor [Hyphomicrobiales bacterium]
MRILVVEDDPRIARDVIETLTGAGYVVDHESDGEEAWFKGDTEEYGAVILDLGLPGMDGLAILKKWRTGGRTFPILVLTARGTWSERVEGIDAGADDYLPKPFEMDELLARLRALIRRSAGHAAPSIAVGEVMLDPRRMRVTVAGVPKALSPQEYRLLSYLMLHAGRVVPQQELAEQLHGSYEDRESNAVEVLIGRVRRKLGVGLIETRRGFGYVIEADKQ